MDKSDINFDLGAVSSMEGDGFQDEVSVEWDDISDETILQMMSVVENIEGPGTGGDTNMTTAVEPATHETFGPAEPEQKPVAPSAASTSFATLSEAEIIKIEEGKDEKTTKSSTNWGVKRIKG